jgi:transcriptional regulator with XRE-family HTH domain
MSAPIRNLKELKTASRNRIRRHIAHEIRELRRRERLTQEILARAIGFKDSAQISKLEHARTGLSRRAAERLDRLYPKTILGPNYSALLDAYDIADRGVDVVPADAPTYEVFLASPMAATADEGAYHAERNSALDVYNALEHYCRMTVYYAGHSIATRDEFEVAQFAARINFSALWSCRYFVLMVSTPTERPSSVWVEAGFALALKKPSLYLAPSYDAVPFMLETIALHDARELLPPVIFQPVKNVAEATALLRTNGRKLFAQLDRRSDA